MLRILGAVALLAGIAALFLIVAIKQQERRGREWARSETAKAMAALRAPPKPPNCPDLPSLADLRLDDGHLADVRIFRFDETVYYIPVEWLQLEPPKYGAIGGIDKMDLGRLDPDLHAVECPGVVHQVTDGGLYLNRYAGISFALRIRTRERAAASIPLIYVHNLRRSYELNIASYQHDGLLASMDHRTLDAYVRVAPDVGVRLKWHPASMTDQDWGSQFRAWSSGPLIRVSPKPWESSIKTKEFAELASAMRELHAWCSKTPNRRPLKPPAWAILE